MGGRRLGCSLDRVRRGRGDDVVVKGTGFRSGLDWGGVCFWTVGAVGIVLVDGNLG